MIEANVEFLRALVRGTDAYEAAADQFGAIAADARLWGDDTLAKGLSALARNQRIRALELRGRLAAAESGSVYWET